MGNPRISWLMVILASFSGFAAKGESQSGSKMDMFSRSKMEATDLPGLRVWMGAPIRITSQVGWDTVVLASTEHGVKDPLFSSLR